MREIARSNNGHYSIIPVGEKKTCVFFRLLWQNVTCGFGERNSYEENINCLFYDYSTLNRCGFVLCAIHYARENKRYEKVIAMWIFPHEKFAIKFKSVESSSEN